MYQRRRKRSVDRVPRPRGVLGVDRVEQSFQVVARILVEDLTGCLAEIGVVVMLFVLAVLVYSLWDYAPL